MIEAGCTVIGGHSIRDEETKFGYSVTGTVHPKKILANAGAKPGDKLLFTKSIGTGVISTAIKKGKAEHSWIDAAIRSMTTLNKTAAEVITTYVGGDNGHAGSGTDHVGTAALGRPGEQSSPAAVHSMTDVTGFGLIGHSREMALASNVSLTFYSRKIPLIDGALECVRAGFIPGGLKNNRDFAECLVEYDDNVPDDVRALIFDPQTAGGLLISVAGEDADRLRQDLNEAGVPAVEIGEVRAPSKPTIAVKG
jgi:selenide,water dikinase